VEVVSEPVGGFWLVVLGFLAVGWGWDGRDGSGGVGLVRGLRVWCASGERTDYGALLEDLRGFMLKSWVDLPAINKTLLSPHSSCGPNPFPVSGSLAVRR